MCVGCFCEKQVRIHSSIILFISLRNEGNDSFSPVNLLQCSVEIQIHTFAIHRVAWYCTIMWYYRLNSCGRCLDFNGETWNWKRVIIDVILTKGKGRIAKMNSKTKLNCVYAQFYSLFCHVPLQFWTIQS